MAKPDKISRKWVQDAFCKECCGEYIDGKVDCENIVCPIYHYMPYRKLEPDYWWMKFNTKVKGKVTWEETTRDLSDEQRKAIADRFRKNVKTGGD